MRKIVIEYDRLPPSDNRIREPKIITVAGKQKWGKPIRKTVIGYTDEANAYLAELRKHIDDEYFAETQQFLRDHDATSFYALSIHLGFPRWEILNKGWQLKHAKDAKPTAQAKHKAGSRKAKSPVKKVDGPNRHKLLQDALAAALSIDDSYTWDLTITKYVSEEPSVTLRLEEVDPIAYGVDYDFLRG